MDTPKPLNELLKSHLEKLISDQSSADEQPNAVKKQASVDNVDLRRWVLGRLHTLLEGRKDD
jgi:hypothetical protein